MAQDLSTRGFLFEVVHKHKDGGDPVHAWALSVPPENVTVEEPQRTHYTKTFSGTFVDDYGPDNQVIRISGSTGGTTVRPVFRVRGPGEKVQYDGMDAFYTFRNLIVRYKEARNILKFEDYELRLYSLYGGRGWGKLFATSASPYDAYVVSLRDFKMVRRKDTPFWFHYEIDLLVLDTLGRRRKKLADFLIELNPLDLVQTVKRGATTVRAYLLKGRRLLSTVNALVGEIDSAVVFADTVISKVQSFVEQSNNVVAYPQGLCRKFKGLLQDAKTTMASVRSAFLSITGDSEERYDEATGLMKEVVTGSDGLVAFGKMTVSSGSKTVRHTTVPSRLDAGAVRNEGLTDEQAERPELALYSSVAPPDDRGAESPGGSPAVTQTGVARNPIQRKDRAQTSVPFTVYGYTPVRVDGAATLESLALEYLGDASLGEVIAAYNDIAISADITPGDVVRIPVVVLGDEPTNNEIYVEGPLDIYGTDIKLDGLGNAVFSSSGDFARISGPDNLLQALNLRLSQELGSRLRLTVYGMRQEVGFANDAATGYILTNLRDTVMQDPRVADVQSFYIRGDGDKLYVMFDVFSVRPSDVVAYRGTL